MELPNVAPFIILVFISDSIRIRLPTDKSIVNMDLLLSSVIFKKSVEYISDIYITYIYVLDSLFFYFIILIIYYVQ